MILSRAQPFEKPAGIFICNLLEQRDIGTHISIIILMMWITYYGVRARCGVDYDYEQMTSSDVGRRAAQDTRNGMKAGNGWAQRDRDDRQQSPNEFSFLKETTTMFPTSEIIGSQFKILRLFVKARSNTHLRSNHQSIEIKCNLQHSNNRDCNQSQTPFRLSSL